MRNLHQPYAAIPIPGIMAILSNTPRIPNYPLIGRFALFKDLEKDILNTPLRLSYHVNSLASSVEKLSGKNFTRLSSDEIRQETPIGGLGRLSVQFKCGNECLELKVNPTYNCLGRLTIGNVHSVGWLMRDLSNIALLNKGYCLLHAAALNYKDRSVILIGLSNTGKTTTIRELVQQEGAFYYGDDLIVTDGDKVFACPLTAANVNPETHADWKYTVIQWIRRTVPFSENYLVNLPISILDMLGQESLADPAPISEILFLQKNSKRETRELSRDKAAKLLLSSNRAEFTFAASPLFAAAEYLGLDCSLSTAVDKEKDIIMNTCRSARCRLVTGGFSDFRKAAASALGF